MSFTVVIPSRTLSNLQPCVRAIRDAGETCQIIVVWDLSRGNQPIPATTDYDVCQVESDDFIFSRNVNEGIKVAGSDDVIVLGDDGLLKTPHGFTALAEFSQDHAEYGLVSAACNNVGNSNQWPKNTGAVRDEPRMICFVCVYIPRRTIEKVGLLDEQFNCYSHQDDDYCLRVRRSGLKIGIHDGAFVDHSTLPSTFRSPGGPGGELATGAAIFRRKHGAGNMEL